MLRVITTAALIAWAGLAHADPYLVYSHHALRVDVHGLDLTRDADLRILKVRIERAAERVCGGRPDDSNLYNPAELKLLLPAYDRCRTAAIQRAAAAIKVPALMLAGNGKDENHPLK